jgi:hypothetical protein
VSVIVADIGGASRHLLGLIFFFYLLVSDAARYVGPLAHHWIQHLSTLSRMLESGTTDHQLAEVRIIGSHGGSE